MWEGEGEGIWYIPTFRQYPIKIVGSTRKNTDLLHTRLLAWSRREEELLYSGEH